MNTLKNTPDLFKGIFTYSLDEDLPNGKVSIDRSKLRELSDLGWVIQASDEDPFFEFIGVKSAIFGSIGFVGFKDNLWIEDPLGSPEVFYLNSQESLDAFVSIINEIINLKKKLIH